MTERARCQFRGPSTSWTQGVAPHLDGDIATVDWDDIAQFTAHVKAIKDVASPVFTSKLCHFLAPRLFPVVDNEGMGNPFDTYEEYYCTAKALWVDTDNSVQRVLVRRLVEEVGEPLSEMFPAKCKLIELHYIGVEHPG